MADSSERGVLGANAEHGLSSSEHLDEYIHVASPASGLLIFALTMVSAALVIWGFTGWLPLSVGYSGYVYDSALVPREYASDSGLDARHSRAGVFVYCFVDSKSYHGERLVGNSAVMRMPDGAICEGKVISCSTTPLSRGEVAEMFDSEWVSSSLVQQEYSWVISIVPDDDLEANLYQTCDVSVVTGQVHPIRFLLR